MRKGTGQPSGFTWQKNHYLFIEEAVYLVDRGDLLLFVELAPTEKGDASAARRLLSIQECYELMTALDEGPVGPGRRGGGCSMERYLVYCTLMRQGFLLMRHPSCWTLESDQDPSEACGEAWRPPGGDSNRVGVKVETERMEVEVEDQREGDGDDMMVGILPSRRMVVAKRGLSNLALEAQAGGGVSHRGWWPKGGPEHPLFQLKSADGKEGGEGRGGWEDGLSNSYLPAPRVDLLKTFPRLRPLPPFESSTSPIKEAAQGQPGASIGSSGRRIGLAYDVYCPGATKQVARARRSYPPLSMHIVVCSDQPPRPSEMHRAEEQARQHAKSLATDGSGLEEVVKEAANVVWASVDNGIVSFFRFDSADLIRLL